MSPVQTVTLTVPGADRHHEIAESGPLMLAGTPPSQVGSPASPGSSLRALWAWPTTPAAI
jgi:hypothetical protein